MFIMQTNVYIYDIIKNIYYYLLTRLFPFLKIQNPMKAPRARERRLVPMSAPEYRCKSLFSVLRSSLSLWFPEDVFEPAAAAVLELKRQERGGSMLGRDLQDKEKSSRASGSRLTTIDLRFSSKLTSSVLGLLGGDFGEAEGVFLHVEESDIMAELMGETRAEERAEFSRCASFSILR